jgi:hypothetical protein
VPTDHEYVAHEGGFDGPEIGAYSHPNRSEPAGPKRGEIIEIEGIMGLWRVTDCEATEPDRTGRLAVERVDDKLVEDHGD